MIDVERSDVTAYRERYLQGPFQPQAEFRQPARRDDRFRKLLGEHAWRALPASIQRRFSKTIGEGQWAVYRGHVAHTYFSRLGWLFAQACRIVGGPLPLFDEQQSQALVAVSERGDGRVQRWNRVYSRSDGFAQVIQSEKRFAGSTGLEEYVGRGIGMALTLSVDKQSLVFRSAYYFIDIFGAQIRLPQWLSPGLMEIVHREEGGQGCFSFTLKLTHPIAGRLVKQTAYFQEEE